MWQLCHCSIILLLTIDQAPNVWLWILALTCRAYADAVATTAPVATIPQSVATLARLRAVPPLVVTLHQVRTIPLSAGKNWMLFAVKKTAALLQGLNKAMKAGGSMTRQRRNSIELAHRMGQTGGLLCTIMPAARCLTVKT